MSGDSAGVRKPQGAVAGAKTRSGSARTPKPMAGGTAMNARLHPTYDRDGDVLSVLEYGRVAGLTVAGVRSAAARSFCTTA